MLIELKVVANPHHTALHIAHRDDGRAVGSHVPGSVHGKHATNDVAPAMPDLTGPAARNDGCDSARSEISYRSDRQRDGPGYRIGTDNRSDVSRRG